MGQSWLIRRQQAGGNGNAPTIRAIAWGMADQVFLCFLHVCPANDHGRERSALAIRARPSL
jgi:hypothetical protein